MTTCICPACAGVLKTAQPMPPGKAIKCPRCNTVFAVPHEPNGPGHVAAGRTSFFDRVRPSRKNRLAWGAGIGIALLILLVLVIALIPSGKGKDSGLAQRPTNSPALTRPEPTAKTTPTLPTATQPLPLPPPPPDPLPPLDRLSTWIKENHSKPVADLRAMMDKHPGQSLLLTLGSGLVRSKKVTILGVRGGEFFVFEVPDDQAKGMSVPELGSSMVGRSGDSEFGGGKPEVTLSDLRIDRADRLDPRSKITGTVQFQRHGTGEGTFALRLTALAVGTNAFFPMGEYIVPPKGEFKFSFGPLAAVAGVKGPLVVFLDLGTYHESGAYGPRSRPVGALLNVIPPDKK